jgi:hypothetical protein
MRPIKGDLIVTVLLWNGVLAFGHLPLPVIVIGWGRVVCVARIVAGSQHQASKHNNDKQ